MHSPPASSRITTLYTYRRNALPNDQPLLLTNDRKLIRGTKWIIPHTHFAGTIISTMLTFIELTNKDMITQHSCDDGFHNDIFKQLFIGLLAFSLLAVPTRWYLEKHYPNSPLLPTHSAYVFAHELWKNLGNYKLVINITLKYKLPYIKIALILLFSPLYQSYVLARHVYEVKKLHLPQEQTTRHGPCAEDTSYIHRFCQAYHVSISFAASISGLFSYLNDTVIGVLMGERYQGDQNTIRNVQGGFLLLCLLVGFMYNSEKRAMLDKTGTIMGAAYFTCLPLLSLIVCLVPGWGDDDYTTGPGWLLAILSFVMFTWVAYARSHMGGHDHFRTPDDPELQAQLPQYQEVPSIFSWAKDGIARQLQHCWIFCRNDQNNNDDAANALETRLLETQFDQRNLSSNFQCENTL